MNLKLTTIIGSVLVLSGCYHNHPNEKLYEHPAFYCYNTEKACEWPNDLYQSNDALVDRIYSKTNEDGNRSFYTLQTVSGSESRKMIYLADNINTAIKRNKKIAPYNNYSNDYPYGIKNSNMDNSFYIGFVNKDQFTTYKLRRTNGYHEYDDLPYGNYHNYYWLKKKVKRISKY
ncbi:hypothetical protein [Vibrio sp. NTOU-M3]|uniref:hypothetical protein n=1 Tax=unclassified Vibrio TaxID=2614977 RepID=UPI00349FACDB